MWSEPWYSLVNAAIYMAIVPFYILGALALQGSNFPPAVGAILGILANLTFYTGVGALVGKILKSFLTNEKRSGEMY